MAVKWVVLLEAARDAGHGPISAGDVKRLRDALGAGPYGGRLHCPDRYALQVTATGASPLDALSQVVARWADAVGQLGLSAWTLVRTEAFTPEDLEREFEGAQRQEIPLRAAEPDAGGDEHDDLGRQLVRLAFSDPLTGLLGREAFAHQLNAALAAAGAGAQRSVAVVRVDLDAFDSVNGRFGAVGGDSILLALAGRLAAMLRPDDVLARFGGDEYAVLLRDTTEQGAVAVAERMLDGVRLGIMILGREAILSASAGVAVSQAGDGEDLVGKAQAALIAAKAAGGGTAVLFDSDVGRPVKTGREFATAALQDRLAHLQLLHQATVAANEADTLHQAAGVVMRHICAQVGCALGQLAISPGASGALPPTPIRHWTEPGEHRGVQEAVEQLLTGTDGLSARVLTTRRPVWLADLAADTDLITPLPAATAGFRSAFAFPVLVGREVVAVLSFFCRTRMEPTPTFFDVLASIGIQLGRVVERQQADTARWRSEMELREAHALARLGSWTFDLHSGEIRWSPEMYTLYGLDPEEPPPDLQGALAAVHPSDRAWLEATLSKVIESGERTAHEVRIVSDGQLRWHRCEVLPLRDETGAVVAIHGVSQDITEAKLAEETLRERERRLTEAQRAAALGWWEHELSTGQETWSDEMYRLMGWEPGRAVTFEEFLAVVHGDDRPRLLEESARLRRTGEPICVDYRVVVDGRERWLRGGGQLLRDENGTPVKLLGTAQDVTTQKQAEEELRRAKDLYQRIVETAHEGILTLDVHDLVTFANHRMAQILGYTVEELVGMPVSALVDEKTRSPLPRHRRRTEGMSEDDETLLRAKDGARVHVLVSASPLIDERGKYTGVLAMVSHITAVREAEEILRAQVLGIQAEVGPGNVGYEPPPR